MRRIIREEEPPKPSTRLTDLVAADVRRLTPSGSEEDRASLRRLLQVKERLISALRGDLDWIVMKCLEKDRARRYETANGLTADIRRHLNNEPVVARPPSVAYRFQKLVRRNKVADRWGLLDGERRGSQWHCAFESRWHDRLHLRQRCYNARRICCP